MNFTCFDVNRRVPGCHDPLPCDCVLLIGHKWGCNQHLDGCILGIDSLNMFYYVLFIPPILNHKLQQMVV